MTKQTNKARPHDSYVTRTGIVRWVSNDNVVPDECLAAAGVDQATRDKCKIVRDRETAKAIADYRRQHSAPTAEHLAELRAAFGPGQDIVDVISGRRIRT